MTAGGPRSTPGEAGAPPGPGLRGPVIAAAALLAAGAALFGPTVRWLTRSWWVHPYYSHGPLLVAVAAWFVWRRRTDLMGPPAVGLGLLLVAAGTVAAAWAAAPGAYAVAAGGLVLAMLGVGALMGGRRAVVAALPAAGLLFLAIPLPWTERVAPLLAARVAAAAAATASGLGVPVARAGAELTVADGAFTVGGPCSGLRSLLALVALGYIVAVHTPGSRIRRGALVAASVPAALAANWLRLTGLLVITDRAGADAGLRLFEGPASPILYVGAAAVLLGAARRLESRHG